LLSALLETARPRQWVKNLFVAAPLVFGKHLDDPLELRRAALAFVLFCMLSSAVYFMNDVADIEADRAHPTKRRRPIPSGRLSPRAAKLAATALAFGGVGACLTFGLDFALYAATYFILNIAYSFKLKHVVYLDVLSIAAGFLLRVLGGGAAIAVWISPWLLSCTVLIACFFGFGKRAHELSVRAIDGADKQKQRAVLRHYRPSVLKWALIATGLATFASYVAYTRAEHTIGFFHTANMIYTAPFAALGLMRFGQLVTRRDQADSPTDAMLKDWTFVASGLAWGAAVCAIIYYR
jgi:4-hydroxybenzoate polyprenyltransferase